MRIPWISRRWAMAEKLTVALFGSMALEGVYFAPGSRFRQKMKHRTFWRLMFKWTVE